MAVLEARAIQSSKSIVLMKCSVIEFLFVISDICDFRMALFRLNNKESNYGFLSRRAISTNLTSLFDTLSRVVAFKFCSFSFKRKKSS
jgi:hypothetical protein